MAKLQSDISPPMRELSAYIAGARNRRLPPEIIEVAKHHLIDTIAAMISGSRLLAGRRAVSYITRLGGVKEATVFATRMQTSCVNAAFANGMMAHADETDDSHTRSQSHPGCGVVPAAWAMGEQKRSHGAALLRAVTLGYDVCTRVLYALGPWALREAGHSSRSFGPAFGAAAAAASVARLSPEQVRYVIAYAAQQASGINCWRRDKEHIEKAFDFGGMPARNGISAATMVESGFTGVSDVFAGDSDFFTTFSASPDLDALTRELGKTYEIANTNIKRWSVGSPIQAALDSLASLIAEHDVKARDVKKMRVTVHKTGAHTVDNPQIADINLQHMMSVMLFDGTVTFASAHDQERMKDPKIKALKRRIELIGSEAFNRVLNRQAIVEITTHDGRVLERRTQAVRGTAANPMTRSEIEAKSIDLTAPVLGGERAAKLLANLWSIEKIADVRKLRPLLQS